jgi:hypothetical protein
MVEDMSFFYPEGFVDRSRMFFERFVYVNVFHESGVSRHVKFRQGYVAVGGECSADVDVRVTNRVSRYVQIRQAVHCSRRINGVCDVYGVGDVYVGFGVHVSAYYVSYGVCVCGTRNVGGV